MSKYAEFKTEAGATLLVEIADGPPARNPTFEAGFAATAKKAAEVAGRTAENLEKMLKICIGAHVSALLDAIEELPKKPEETEIGFNLKVAVDSGSVAALCIGKLSGEANYSVTVKWKNNPAARIVTE